MIQGLWRNHAAGARRGHGQRGVEGRGGREEDVTNRSKAGGLQVYTYSTVGVEDVGSKQESFAELHAHTTVRRLPYPGDRLASAAMIRKDDLAVLVNVNGWCDAGANDLFVARLAPVQVKTETRNPKPNAQIPKTRDPEPENRNLKPETRNAKTNDLLVARLALVKVSYIIHPGPETRNPKPETRQSR
jgi:hypothetical protein